MQNTTFFHQLLYVFYGDKAIRILIITARRALEESGWFHEKILASVSCSLTRLYKYYYFFSDLRVTFLPLRY